MLEAEFLASMEDQSGLVCDSSYHSSSLLGQSSETLLSPVPLSLTPTFLSRTHCHVSYLPPGGDITSDGRTHYSLIWPHFLPSLLSALIPISPPGRREAEL